VPGKPEFRDKYFITSQGAVGDERGPFNEGPQWDYTTAAEGMMAVDGGDGLASVKMKREEKQLEEQLMMRGQSNTAEDPTTGADLGAGPGAGATTGETANAMAGGDEPRGKKR
jgi:Mn-containing catalase